MAELVEATTGIVIKLLSLGIVNFIILPTRLPARQVSDLIWHDLATIQFSYLPTRPNGFILVSCLLPTAYCQLPIANCQLIPEGLFSYERKFRSQISPFQRKALQGEHSTYHLQIIKNSKQEARSTKQIQNFQNIQKPKRMLLYSNGKI